jgi:hypothetical protein
MVRPKSIVLAGLTVGSAIASDGAISPEPSDLCCTGSAEFGCRDQRNSCEITGGRALGGANLSTSFQSITTEALILKDYSGSDHRPEFVSLNTLNNHANAGST